MSEERGRILIVDDESEIRELLGELLGASHECCAVGSASEALALLCVEKFDLVLSDILMQGMDGLEMLPRLKRLVPETMIIMISGAQTLETAIASMRAGAFDYITKPFDLEYVEIAVKRALEHKGLQAAKRHHEIYLEELIGQRTLELDRAFAALEETYRATLRALAAALETRDAETHGHSERVVQFSLRLGREMHLSDEELRSLEFGALLHDIGKLGVPDAILRKPGPLNEEEWRSMRQHPLLGQRILWRIDFLKDATHVVAEHHEKWDGTGYPHGLRGTEIDLKARIFAVADAFDAVVSNRVYRNGRSYETARAELERQSGSQFDPQVIEAFLRIPSQEWEGLRQRQVSRAAAPAPHATNVRAQENESERRMDEALLAQPESLFHPSGCLRLSWADAD